jgi:hypothetical protein
MNAWIRQHEYEPWIGEVRRLAKERELEWLIGSADLLDSFYEGMTPEAALEVEAAEAARNV